MKKTLILIMLMVYFIVPFAEARELLHSVGFYSDDDKNEPVYFTRRQCVDILINLRILSPKTKRAKDINLFKIYYDLYYAAECQDVLTDINDTDMKKIIRGKQDVPYISPEER